MTSYLLPKTHPELLNWYGRVGGAQSSILCRRKLGVKPFIRFNMAEKTRKKQAIPILTVVIFPSFEAFSPRGFAGTP